MYFVNSDLRVKHKYNIVDISIWSKYNNVILQKVLKRIVFDLTSKLLDSFLSMIKVSRIKSKSTTKGCRRKVCKKRFKTK